MVSSIKNHTGTTHTQPVYTHITVHLTFLNPKSYLHKCAYRCTC